MDLLKIRLFGNVELCHGTERRPDFPTQKSRALFALLVLRRDRLFSRDRLANDFWADLAEERAKKCLSTDLWRIRIILKRGGFEPDDYIKIHNDGVGFNGSAKYWLDISTFEQHLDTVGRMPPEQIGEKERNCLLASIELYRGDLLDGIYDDWCLVHRESLRAQYLSALELLMRYHMEQQAWELAVGYGQKLVHDDVLLEHIHRTLMRCYYLMGNRPAAIRQYATCTQGLCAVSSASTQWRKPSKSIEPSRVSGRSCSASARIARPATSSPTARGARRRSKRWISPWPTFTQPRAGWRMPANSSGKEP